MNKTDSVFYKNGKLWLANEFARIIF
jgi:hypothetical protein